MPKLCFCNLKLDGNRKKAKIREPAGPTTPVGDFQAEKDQISSMTAPPLVSCRCSKGHPTLARLELGKSTECSQGLCMPHL